MGVLKQPHMLSLSSLLLPLRDPPAASRTHTHLSSTLKKLPDVAAQLSERCLHLPTPTTKAHGTLGGASNLFSLWAVSNEPLEQGQVGKTQSQSPRLWWKVGGTALHP